MPTKYIYIENLDNEDQKICKVCQASGEIRTEETTYPICKLARFEKDNGRLPNSNEASLLGLTEDTNHEVCPNGYLIHSSREIR